MMFKVRVRLDVTSGGLGSSVKTEVFETMMDSETYANCNSSVGKKIVEAAWLNSMFPGAKEIRIHNAVKI